MKWLLATVGITLVALAAGAAWLLGTQAGLRWSAEQAVAASGGRLALNGLRGTLAGEIAFDEIGFRDEGTDIRLKSGELQLELLAVLGGRAGLRSLRAQSLDIRLAKGGGPRRQPPALPMGVRVASAQIASLRVDEFVIQDFRLADAAIRQDGAVAGSASFAARWMGYPARIEVQLAGTLQRAEAAISARVADMAVSAKARLEPFAERPLRRLEARAGPVDLSRLQAQWPRTALTLELAGSAGAAQAFGGELALRNALPGPLDAERLPLATLDAQFTTDFASVSLTQLRATGAGLLTGSARVEARRARLELRTVDLDLRALRSTLRQTRLSGPLTVLVTESSQSVQGSLAQEGMRLAAEAVRTGELVDIRNLRAEAAGGEATGSARVHLGEPLRFEAALRLARFNPARFGQYPEGSLNGEVRARGTLQEPFAVDARWSVSDSTLRGERFVSRGSGRFMPGRVSRLQAEAELGSARATAQGAFGGAADEIDLRLETPDMSGFAPGVSGRLSASARLTGTWRTPRGSVQAQASRVVLPNGMALASLSAQASGQLGAHQAQLRLKAEGIDAMARLQGGWREGDGWVGELEELKNSGSYPLELTAPAPVAFGRGHATVGRLEARLAGGSLVVQRFEWSETRIASRGEARSLPAQWLILAAGLADRAKASMLIDGRWDLTAAPELAGSLALQRHSGDIALVAEGTPLELRQAQFQARFAEGAAHITSELTSRYGTANVRGTIGGYTADAAVDVTAHVRLAELRTLLQPLLDDARVEGGLTAELHAGGTLGKVSLSGSLAGERLALQVPPYGVFLKDGELRAVLEGDRLRVGRFSIEGSGGRLTASGILPLRGQEGAHLQWQAANFGLLARPDLRLTVSGAGEARLENRRVSLSGALRADRGYLELQQGQLPQLGDDVVIAGEPRPAARQAARVPVALDVQLDLGDELQVRGHGFEGRLSGRLQIETARDGTLRAYGRIQAVNATFLAYGQRLQVDPGIAIFDGPVDNPSLQLTAWRRNQQVEAGVQISGTVKAPRVQLVSQPPVPEGERLSWLVLGRAPGDATKADLGLLQAAAGALLARGDRMPLDRRVAQAFGLDEIALRGSGEVGSRVVAVGKRLSDRLYVSYEQGLGVVASSLVKLDLALSQRWSVRAETGTSSGLGLFYRFSWD